MSHDPYSSDANPYATTSPSAFAAPAQHFDSAENIRRNFLSHEASVKSIGILYYLGGVLGVLISLGYLGMGIGVLADPSGEFAEGGAAVGWVMIVFGILGIPFSIFQLWCAYGLRRLRPYSRVGSAVCAAFGLLAFPVGTAISAYVLYLLLSGKGEHVFSPEYRAVIEATPHVKYRTSWIVKLLAGLLILVFGVVIVGLFLS